MAQDLSMALRNGAQGYLLKTIDGDLLAQAIRRAAAGEPVVSPELMGKLVAAFQSQGVPEVDALESPVPGKVHPEAAPDTAEQRTPLSPREEDVLREIARGSSNKEIARALDIAETTVKIHVQHILRKLGLSSRVQAAVYASDRQRGIGSAPCCFHLLSKELARSIVLSNATSSSRWRTMRLPRPIVLLPC